MRLQQAAHWADIRWQSMENEKDDYFVSNLAELALDGWQHIGS